MKNRTTIIIIIIETVLLLISLLICGIVLIAHPNHKRTEVYRQHSDNKSQSVFIYQVGEPFLFGPANYYVDGPSDFSVIVCDDGGVGSFRVEWESGCVRITFSGSEQKDAVYELPLYP